MSETITLELPTQAVSSAKIIAVRTKRPIEDILVEWIDRAAAEVPVESLTDQQLLFLCDLQMDEDQQDRLNDLLAKNREGQIQELERSELDSLMGIYRRGLVRKANAFKEAVSRGLKDSLG